jgi:uncharacterized protein
MNASCQMLLEANFQTLDSQSLSSCVTLRSDSGSSCLHLAIIGSGAAPLVAELINKNADVNVRNKYGETPLHWAAHKGLHKIVAILIKNKADVTAQDNGLFKPLSFHPISHTNFCRFQEGNLPIHWSVQAESAKTMRALLTQRYGLHHINFKGETPLDVCIAEGNLTGVKLLLKYGALVDYDSLAVAASYEEKTIYKYLKKHV